MLSVPQFRLPRLETELGFLSFFLFQETFPFHCGLFAFFLDTKSATIGRWSLAISPRKMDFGLARFVAAARRLLFPLTQIVATQVDFLRWKEMYRTLLATCE